MTERRCMICNIKANYQNGGNGWNNRGKNWRNMDYQEMGIDFKKFRETPIRKKYPRKIYYDADCNDRFLGCYFCWSQLKRFFVKDFVNGLMDKQEKYLRSP